DLRVTMETKIVDWADSLIAATPAEHAQLRWLYRADRRKIAVVPPGVDDAVFSPSSQLEAKVKLGISPDTRLLLFVGRIEPLKAVDTILEAISIIRANEPELLTNMRFAIIGGNSDNPEL